MSRLITLVTKECRKSTRKFRVLEVRLKFFRKHRDVAAKRSSFYCFLGYTRVTSEKANISMFFKLILIGFAVQKTGTSPVGGRLMADELAALSHVCESRFFNRMRSQSFKILMSSIVGKLQK